MDLKKLSLRQQQQRYHHECLTFVSHYNTIRLATVCFCSTGQRWLPPRLGRRRRRPGRPTVGLRAGHGGGDQGRGELEAVDRGRRPTSPRVVREKEEGCWWQGVSPGLYHFGGRNGRQAGGGGKQAPLMEGWFRLKKGCEAAGLKEKKRANVSETSVRIELAEECSSLYWTLVYVGGHLRGPEILMRLQRRVT